MAIVERLRSWFSGTDSDGEAGGRPVMVAEVRAYQAPILTEVLARNDITFEVVETHNPATWEPKARILVPRDQVERADEVIRVFNES